MNNKPSAKQIDILIDKINLLPKNERLLVLIKLNRLYLEK
jgi:hypothetical protein